MWNCGNCGCQNIAPDVADCPQCFTPRAQEQPAPAKPTRQPKAAKAADQSDQAAQEGGEQKSG